jgi:hypothetical protein
MAVEDRWDLQVNRVPMEKPDFKENEADQLNQVYQVLTAHKVLSAVWAWTVKPVLLVKLDYQVSPEEKAIQVKTVETVLPEKTVKTVLMVKTEFQVKLGAGVSSVSVVSEVNQAKLVNKDQWALPVQLVYLEGQVFRVNSDDQEDQVNEENLVILEAMVLLVHMVRLALLVRLANKVVQVNQVTKVVELLEVQEAKKVIQVKMVLEVTKVLMVNEGLKVHGAESVKTVQLVNLEVPVS